jgi:hypothetical protein
VHGSNLGKLQLLRAPFWINRSCVAGVLVDAISLALSYAEDGA